MCGWALKGARRLKTYSNRHVNIDGIQGQSRVESRPLLICAARNPVPSCGVFFVSESHFGARLVVIKRLISASAIWASSKVLINLIRERESYLLMTLVITAFNKMSLGR